MAKNKKTKQPVKCDKCSYIWKTISTMDNLSCPNCLKKTKNVLHQEEPKDNDFGVEQNIDTKNYVLEEE